MDDFEGVEYSLARGDKRLNTDPDDLQFERVGKDTVEV
jgi:hypothetical protein